MTLDPTAAFRAHMAIQTKQHTRSILFDFMQEIGMPPGVKSKFFDARELNSEEAQESAFRTAFPTFPYLVGIVPPSLAMKFTTWHSTFGRAGHLAKAYDEFCLRYHVFLASMTPIMLLRLPRLKPLYVASVTMRSAPLGFQITLPSESGYFITIESLQDFMRHSTGELIHDWMRNAVSGSY